MISTAVWGKTSPSEPLRTERFLGRQQYHNPLSSDVRVIFAIVEIFLMIVQLSYIRSVETFSIVLCILSI